MRGLREKGRAVMHLGMLARRRSPAAPCHQQGLGNNLGGSAHPVVFHL